MLKGFFIFVHEMQSANYVFLALTFTYRILIEIFKIEFCYSHEKYKVFG